jgi:hypothetical protein
MCRMSTARRQRLLASRCESSRRRAADAERQIRLLHHTAFVQSGLPRAVTQAVGRHVRTRADTVQRLRLLAGADDAELRHNRRPNQVARLAARGCEEKQASASASVWPAGAISGLERRRHVVCCFACVSVQIASILARVGRSDNELQRTVTGRTHDGSWVNSNSPSHLRRCFSCVRRLIDACVCSDIINVISQQVGWHRKQPSADRFRSNYCFFLSLSRTRNRADGELDGRQGKFPAGLTKKANNRYFLRINAYCVIYFVACNRCPVRRSPPLARRRRWAQVAPDDTRLFLRYRNIYIYIIYSRPHARMY